MQLAVVGAVIIGGVGGGLAALVASSAPSASVVYEADRAPATSAPRTPPAGIVAPASVASAVLQPAAAQPTILTTPPEATPQLMVATAMTAVLTRFASWARNHAGDPCPDMSELGITALDPWRRAIELTCSDQPAGQMIGAISAGPDGIIGNDDDIASWALGREVTEVVRGARWQSLQPSVTRSRSIQRRKEGSPAAPAPQPGEPASPSSTPAASTPSSMPAIPAVRSATTRPADPGDDIPARR
jgi:hypothetical protein